MDDIKELKKKLKLELKLDLRKCEYCDWQPSCCEWCGKLKNNERKICEKSCDIKKKEIIPSKEKTLFFLASINNNIIMDELRKTSVADLIRTWIDLMRANT